MRECARWAAMEGGGKGGGGSDECIQPLYLALEFLLSWWRALFCREQYQTVNVALAACRVSASKQRHFGDQGMLRVKGKRWRRARDVPENSFCYVCNGNRHGEVVIERLKWWMTPYVWGQFHVWEEKLNKVNTVRLYRTLRFRLVSCPVHRKNAVGLQILIP